MCKGLFKHTLSTHPEQFQVTPKDSPCYLDFAESERVPCVESLSLGGQMSISILTFFSRYRFDQQSPVRPDLPKQKAWTERLLLAKQV